MDSTDSTPTPARGPAEYDMKHKSRGYALIINNKEFAKLPPRKWTDKDAEDIKALLITLGFQEECIKVHTNAKKEDMLKFVQDAAAEKYNDCDCFVCFILSHGGEGVVMGTDDEPVSLSKLVTNFKNCECKSLEQKPKIFVVQACAGKEADLGVVAQQQTESDHSNDFFNKGKPVPTAPNYLIAQSSVSGYLSWANPKKGSPFIQTLVKVISENWKDQDFVSMLTEVNRTVDTFDVAAAVGHQMPCFSTMLTKKLFFRTS